jgi:hypothetical protein
MKSINQIVLCVILMFGATSIFASWTPDPIDNWSLYTDTESKTCFVDFESIAVKLQVVSIEDQDGNEVFNDNVTDLPVDAIYEIDLSTLEIGTYSINLKYYTGEISKLITVE